LLLGAAVACRFHHALVLMNVLAFDDAPMVACCVFVWLLKPLYD
jgi:hypothetical protein